ncbi:uncharacterized protein LOC120353588 [Nilaparvata lugens]|uniref:uncharacterized protein LOC120353588 n=1 Tax=Nilaparvata lugens TaxID=108931 RepID=UPI00193E5075|nr:uncharacterized protein LOC120353588 [Nilaparvata lugens]
MIMIDDLKLEEFVERLVCIASYTDGSVKVIYFLVNRRLAKHLANVFREDFLLCSNFQIDPRTLRRGKELSKLACTLLWILISSTSLVWIVTPLIQCHLFQRCVYLRVIPTWFPFDQSQGFKNVLAYCLDSANVFYNALILFTGNAWMLTLIIMVCAQMNLLKDAIANIRVIAEKQVDYDRNNRRNASNIGNYKGSNWKCVRNCLNNGKSNESYANNITNDKSNDADHVSNNEKYDKNGANHGSYYSEYSSNDGSYSNRNKNYKEEISRSQYTKSLLREEHKGENLDLDKDVRNKMDKILKVCLNDHQKMLRTIGLMEKLLSPVNLFQMIVSSIMVCSTVFVMILPFALKSKRGDNGALDKMMKHGIKYSFFCADAIMELLIFSLSGLMISEQTKSMHRVFYNSDWQNASRSYKKNVLFATTRAAVPLTLTAGKFYDVDLQSFASIMKISYSCLMLLYGLVSKRQLEFQM